MKHVKHMSKRMPAKAFWVDDHPPLKDSLQGFFSSPIDVIRLHLGKNEVQ